MMIIQWKRDQGSLSNRAGTWVSIVPAWLSPLLIALLSPRRECHDTKTIPARRKNQSSFEPVDGLEFRAAVTPDAAPAAGGGAKRASEIA
jgi:hypothetical protein